MDKIISEKVILRANLTKCHFVGYNTYWLKYINLVPFPFGAEYIGKRLFLLSQADCISHYFPVSIQCSICFNRLRAKKGPAPPPREFCRHILF